MNLRPSGYEPDELPGCSIPRQMPHGFVLSEASSLERYDRGLFRFGSDLLSHAFRRSTIGATVLNDRVRDGTGCFTCAMTTKPKKPSVFQVLYAVFVYAFDLSGKSLSFTGSNQAYRAISTSQLNALLHLHLWPIDVVVYHGSQGYLVLRGASRLDAFSGYPVRS